MYAEDPRLSLRVLRPLARDGGFLSLLEKNRDGIALRPGFQGDYREAQRLLDEAVSAGRLGIENRAHTVAEWEGMFRHTGWEPLDWVGVRLFSDTAPDDLSEEEFNTLLDLEREAGCRDPYRRVARLFHLWARATATRTSQVGA